MTGGIQRASNIDTAPVHGIWWALITMRIYSGLQSDIERIDKMIQFDCKGFYDDNGNTLRGYISKMAYFGSHIEISIHLQRPAAACICKISSGYFVYFPCYENGTNLPSLFDIGENTGRLAAIFYEKDAATVAHAIAKVGNLLAKPRRRRKVYECSDDLEVMPF